MNAQELRELATKASGWKRAKVEWNSGTFFVRMPTIGQKRALFQKLGIQKEKDEVNPEKALEAFMWLVPQVTVDDAGNRVFTDFDLQKSAELPDDLVTAIGNAALGLVQQAHDAGEDSGWKSSTA